MRITDHRAYTIETFTVEMSREDRAFLLALIDEKIETLQGWLDGRTNLTEGERSGYQSQVKVAVEQRAALAREVNEGGGAQ